MFLAPLEEFWADRSRIAGFGLLSLLLPQAVGTAVGVASLGFSLLTALLSASHTLLAYSVVGRSGVGDNGAVTTATGGTILTDVVALLVLAVVHRSAAGETTLWF